jgi:hypothetical protein
MAHYRKQKNGRAYFMISEGKVTRVINKSYQSEILGGTNPVILDGATDEGDTEECSKEDFDRQYAEANAVINLKII